MTNLRTQLQQCLQDRVCLMGLGNMDYGDDGFGVRLVERVRAREGVDEEGPSNAIRGPWSVVRGPWTVDRRLSCVLAGTTPERFVGSVAQRSFDHLIFVDAVDFGGAPGSVVLLDSAQMSSRFPQISTHKMSLGLLAKWVEANGTTKAWLLGVQPESLKPGGGLSPALQTTLGLLQELLTDTSAEVSI